MHKKYNICLSAKLKVYSNIVKLFLLSTRYELGILHVQTLGNFSHVGSSFHAENLIARLHLKLWSPEVNWIHHYLIFAYLDLTLVSATCYKHAKVYLMYRELAFYKRHWNWLKKKIPKIWSKSNFSGVSNQMSRRRMLELFDSGGIWCIKNLQNLRRPVVKNALLQKGSILK